MTQRRELLQFAGAGLAGMLGLPALAQEDYPNKPISMLVPFPPGGVADTVGRPVAEAMGRALKQSMIVENKGGAGGGIGMAQV
ncbi:MAG: tripartite tricarboxylate transporter substrate binding protein, partial [Burkholderiales bacterium]|nr:tripartite tricarboxylate transporter substrate binding protein [Burkholderiales bacterium]